MTVAPRISLLLILLTLFGCASQLHRPQTSQAVAEKMQEEQQSKKTAIPTITYRLSQPEKKLKLTVNSQERSVVAAADL